MINFNLLATAVLALILTSCGFKTEEKIVTKPSDQAPTATGREIMNDASFRASIKAIEKGTLELAKDKQQGQILVAGILTNLDEKSEEAKKILVANNPTLVESREMSSGEVETMMDITKRNTFINIGCKNIPKQEIEGLTEIKAKIDNKTDFFHAHAQRVFICGKGQVNRKHTVVYAQEVYMDNSEFVFTRGNGLVNICAKNLVLTGQNKISTIESAKNPMGAGSPVFLSVLESIEGAGKLHINDNK